MPSRTVRILVAVLVAALLGAACSGSDDDSANLTPVDAPAPGVLYISSSGGELQRITPESGVADVLVRGTDAPGAAETATIVDVAPARSGSGVQVIVQTSLDPFRSSVFDLDGDALAPLEATDATSAGPVVTCLDPHVGAQTPVAHLAEVTDTGTRFVPVALDGRELDAMGGLDMTSVACPRWNRERTLVATAVALRPNDAASIVTVVQTLDGTRTEVGFEGCGTTPSSISPDDAQLVIAVTCYSAAWERSGLYLVPLDSLQSQDGVAPLNELVRLGPGLYGRSSWHPDGEWIAAMHADPIPEQNIAVDLSTQPVGVQLIELDTRRIVSFPLLDDAEPFAVAWLDDALSN